MLEPATMMSEVTNTAGKYLRTKSILSHPKRQRQIADCLPEMQMKWKE
jgi:hypothetical protein